MAIYLEYEGIEGGAKATGYEKCIEIDSMDFGSGRNASSKMAHKGEDKVTDPHVFPINLTKSVDGSSVPIFRESISGSPSGKKAVIKFVQGTGNEEVKYMEYELTDCLISNYHVEGGSGSLSEAFELVYAEITMHWDGYDPKKPASKRGGLNMKTLDRK